MNDPRQPSSDPQASAPSGSAAPVEPTPEPRPAEPAGGADPPLRAGTPGDAGALPVGPGDGSARAAPASGGRQSRSENVSAGELTVEEVEALFAAQRAGSGSPWPGPPAAPGPRGPAPVGSAPGESDMDRLLRALGEDRRAWLPPWAESDPSAARDRRPKYTVADAYADESGGAEGPLELRRSMRDLEVSLAAVDDTTVETRDKVAELVEKVAALRALLEGQDESLGTLKAINGALTEELRELRCELAAFLGALARAAGAPGGLRAPPPPRAGTAGEA
jgi:hypothetical protein